MTDPRDDRAERYGHPDPFVFSTVSAGRRPIPPKCRVLRDAGRHHGSTVPRQRSTRRGGEQPREGKTLEEWLPLVLERIVERCDPLKVILFGSLARAEPNYDSDMDWRVVEDHVPRENRRKLAADIRVALADAPIPMGIVVTDPDEISRRGT